MSAMPSSRSAPSPATTETQNGEAGQAGRARVLRQMQDGVGSEARHQGGRKKKRMGRQAAVAVALRLAAA